MNYKNLVRAAKVFFKEKYEPLLRKYFEGDVRRKEEQISQWKFWYMNHFVEGAEWASEQFAKEKQVLIQEYEDKLNKLNQREETIRDNIKRANSRYGFEGLF